ncbi:hypothetical protein FD977_04615 [Polynucleobacter sp. AP-Elch-400A-B2]|uniref:hypothetical protein n=1 Tax=Polynucleobacter sp. AP-Elch-400A-B2 TaxID=2576930 RepID=UPI001BFCF240|nr:hypothetical protein [Polynucleobacter sp. AP-Elch-400A-B2]QWE25528.1 hypothetical protein FD977_04615 [Polynucleobacter sp. AP-Elch-400A-B2]
MSLPPILDDLIRYCQVKSFSMEKVANFRDQWESNDDLNSLEAIAIPCPECFMNDVKDSRGLYQLGLDEAEQQYMKCYTCKVKIPVTDEDDI